MRGQARALYRLQMAAYMMMGLSLCSPIDTRMSSVKSFPAPASPMSTVGFTCAVITHHYCVFLLGR